MPKTTVTQGLLATLLLVLLASAAFANKSAAEIPSTINTIQTSRLNQHIQALNELTERRRVSRFFNVQTPLPQGLTKNYVATSTGQLQFELRDLVLPGRAMVMASRVHDSALDNGDFGKGWQLSLTSANELIIARDAANRVTSITDKHGRQVNYSYNKQGLLETATDLGGQVWQYRYFGHGLLKQVIDPENHIAASFKYDNQGRVRFAQVRATETNYQYSDGQTVVFEDKNQTVFHFNSEGITTSVTNAEGFTSSVKLDENHQVVELSHNNQRTAVFTYLPDGRTESITQGDNVNILQYNAQNQFTGLLHDSESVMDIKRDDEGRPLSISGDGARREYTYYPNGDVETFKSGDIERTFQYYPNGLLKQLVENGKAAGFEYNNLGRLQKITFPTGEVHEYQYDARGFRKSTTKNDGSKLHYNYDKTGNYRGNTATDIKGDKTIREIVLDQHNQVKQQLIDGRLNMDVTYQRGNPKSLTHGEYTIEYDFDKLNRLNKVSNGLAEPIEYTYANDEEDLRMQQDDRTLSVYLDKKETSLAATLYTRTTQTPWPHIIWNEALGQLQLASKIGIIPPDTIFLSAAKRRRLYDAVMRNKQSSKDFNKPSSSFWTPPEYLATNCDPTECMIYGVFFDPIGPIYLGQPVEISALAESDLSCDPNYTFYIDGQIVYASSSFSSIQHTFNTTGNHEIKVISRCACAESNVWGVWAFEQVVVQLPKITVTKADITHDQIEVKLDPQWMTGNLQITLVENTGAELQLFNETKSGGTQTFSFNIDSLLDGKTYHYVKARWRLNNVTFTHQREHKFKVLGNYRHSQYNTPSQSSTDCKVGALKPIYITTGGQYGSQCFAESTIYYEDNFYEKFKSQVDLNGSGNTILYGAIQKDVYCPTTPNSPANSLNTTFRQISHFIPACSNLHLGDDTVAFHPDHPDLKCGDKVYIAGEGVKTATDFCAICSFTQLDNYTTSSGKCTNILDLSSSTRTIKLL